MNVLVYTVFSYIKTDYMLFDFNRTILVQA
jgi:hypothetical protein